MARSVRALVGILVVAAFTLGGSAQAVIGTPDTGHPYVGAAIQLQTHGGQTGYQLCSGFLISATKFVTDAHCFPSNAQPIQVTFDGVTAPAPGVLVAANPIAGSVVNHPGFCPDCGKAGNAVDDVAVITLSQPHVLPTYASLPGIGTADSLPNKQAVDVVGFGWTGVSHKAPTGFGSRQVATTQLASAGVLGDNYLAVLDDPGACLGDSGGPDLLAGTDVAIAVTTFGNGNPNCNGVSYSQRLDTQAIQSFILGA